MQTPGSILHSFTEIEKKKFEFHTNHIFYEIPDWPRDHLNVFHELHKVAHAHIQNPLSAYSLQWPREVCTERCLKKPTHTVLPRAYTRNMLICEAVSSSQRLSSWRGLLWFWEIFGNYNTGSGMSRTLTTFPGCACTKERMSLKTLWMIFRKIIMLKL